MNSKRRVVIVDEDPTYLKMWEKVFRLMNCYNFCLTNDPKVAEAIAKEAPVDLLISEAVMSGENGFELAEHVRKANKKAEVILTTVYDCDLKRFNLKDPKFHILHKPYQKIEDVIHFLADIMQDKDPCKDKTIDEDSWSENEEYPNVMEWKL